MAKPSTLINRRNVLVASAAGALYYLQAELSAKPASGHRLLTKPAFRLPRTATRGR